MFPRLDNHLARICAAGMIAAAVCAQGAAAQEMSANEIMRRLQMQRSVMPSAQPSATVTARASDPARTSPIATTRRPPAAQDQTIDLVILFALGSDELAPQAERQLSQLCIAMRNDLETGARYQVIGHTDATGDARENLILSQSRAERVVSWLAGPDCRLDQRRMTPVGRGETRLRLPERPDDAANRRVEIQIRS